MRIIIRGQGSGEIAFLRKGAGVVVAKIVRRNDRFGKEIGNTARDGTRPQLTLSLSTSRGILGFWFGGCRREVAGWSGERVGTFEERAGIKIRMPTSDKIETVT